MPAFAKDNQEPEPKVPGARPAGGLAGGVQPRVYHCQHWPSNSRPSQPRHPPCSTGTQGGAGQRRATDGVTGLAPLT